MGGFLVMKAKKKVEHEGMPSIKTIGVVGAGQMGTGIAQVSAQAGFKVVVVVNNEETIGRVQKEIDTSLNRAIELGKINRKEKDKIISHLTFSRGLKNLEKADIVIEAAVENASVKEDIFCNLDKICPPHTILSTNTSSISITKLANITQRPAKVVGMHFMYPAQKMKLVEIIKTPATSDETYHIVKNLALKMGKTPITAIDSPCFVTSRLIQTLINEAIFCLYEGVSTKEEIDAALKLGMNHPMGPLELADFIGLDVVLSMQEALYNGFKDPKYRPCPLLASMVEAGHLGRKTRRGFYEYK